MCVHIYKILFTYSHLCIPTCVTVSYILLKALPQVFMENTARGGVLRDQYSMRQSRGLYLSRDMSPIAVFFVHMIIGSVLGGILYLELLLIMSQHRT